MTQKLVFFRCKRPVGLRTPRAGIAVEELERRFHHPTCARMPCMLLYGDSGMGKSMILEKMERQHPSSYDERKGITKATGRDRANAVEPRRATILYADPGSLGGALLRARPDRRARGPGHSSSETAGYPVAVHLELDYLVFFTHKHKHAWLVRKFRLVGCKRLIGKSSLGRRD